MTSPRGVRLSNPGNLRHGNPWQGLADDQPDPDFCKFASPAWGFRAMATTLQTYKDRYQIDTVTKIVSRWAPPEENDTAAYIADVCHESGFRPDEGVNAHQYVDAYKLVRAITIHEQGGFEQYFTKDQLDDGLLRAGCEGAPRSPISKIGVVVTGSASAVAAAAPSVVDAINTYKPVIDQSHSQTLKTVFTVIAIVFAALAVVNHVRAASK